MNEKEFFMSGRIDARHVSDIVKTRTDRDFYKKIPSVASLASNADYLLKNQAWKDQILRWLETKVDLHFQPVGIIIDPNKPYLCCSPDGT